MLNCGKISHTNCHHKSTLWKPPREQNYASWSPRQHPPSHTLPENNDPKYM